MPEERSGGRPAAPVAPMRPHAVASPHGTRIDEYYWLRDDARANAEVLAHLAAENAYKDALLAPLRPLQDRLFAEIIARIRQDDVTVPYHERGHWYYRRFEAGDEYPVYARRPGSMESNEQVLLDLRERSAGRDYYDLGALEVSPDNRLLAFTEDTVGRRQYVLRWKDLETGELLPDEVPNVEEGIAWAADSHTVLYVEKDPQTLLGLRVRAHRLGTAPADDPVVYEEQDESFYTSVGHTKDRRFLLIHSSSTLTSETRCARSDDASLAFVPLLPREHGHEYDAEHLDGQWILRTNRDAPNFRIVCADIDRLREPAAWRELLSHRADAYLHGFEVFRDFLAVEERSDGLRRVRILPRDGGESYLLDADEPAFRAALGANPDLDTGVVRFTVTSLATPQTTYDYDVATRTRTLRKREPVLGDFDPARYVTDYLRAPARDGAAIPVAVVHRRGLPLDGTAPLLQQGYGAYGVCSDPVFSSSLLSLLDRGFVYAIAQVRGGQELGRPWYEAGRLLCKRNTFTDFVDVTRFLVARGYCDPRRVVARGGSAGGLLMGAIANLAPGDYRALVAQVPFVDIVTTMLDESIPLTTNEYDEWGDPRERPYYEYMLSYSPYDNVARQDYPAMLVTTGLWDSQVQYFEPAKWVARLRRLKTDPRPLLLRVDMDAGHGGKSGRWQAYRELAEEYAFILGEVGLAD